MVTPWLTPILKERFERVTFFRPYAGPSNVINLCSRQFAFAMQEQARQSKVENREKGKTVRTGRQDLRQGLIFESGHVAETIVINLLQKAGIKIVSSQIEIQADNFGLTSKFRRSDALIYVAEINNPPDTSPLKIANGKHVLLEFKKMNPVRFANFRKHGLEVEEAAHFQLLDYLKNWNIAFEESLGTKNELPKVEFGCIVGIRLEPIDIIDTIVVWGEEGQTKYNEFIPKLQEIENIKINQGDPLPPRPYLRDDSKCKSCYFQFDCWSILDRFDITNVDLTDEDQKFLNEAIVSYSEAKEKIKAEKKALEKLINDLDLFLQSKKGDKLAYISDIGRIYAEIYEDHKIRFDGKAFALAYPELYRKFLRRVHKVKFGFDIKKYEDVVEGESDNIN